MRNEHVFLKTRIQALMAQRCSIEEIYKEKEKMSFLQDTLQKLNVGHEKLFRQLADEDYHFISRISDRFDQQVKETKEEKVKNELLYLGRWQFIKDWLSQRQDFHETQLLLTQISERVIHTNLE